VNRLRAGWPRNPSMIPGRVRDFSLPTNIHTDSGAHPAFAVMGTGGFYLGWNSCQGVKQTIRSHSLVRFVRQKKKRDYISWLSRIKNDYAGEGQNKFTQKSKTWSLTSNYHHRQEIVELYLHFFIRLLDMWPI
jgi:hypothetical protein